MVPHLPLDTDTRIATAVASAVAERLTGDWLLAPAIGYGASGEHEGFPGTVSIGTAALQLLLVEFGRSACNWASRLVFVNGHGGNVDAVAERNDVAPRGRARRRLVLRARRRAATPTPATPKPLYCYIFRRRTSGSTNACPETKRRWPS